MASYKELLAQREALEKQIAETRQSELNDAVQRVRSLISEFGLTQDDIFPSGNSGAKRTSSAKGSSVAPKYRDPATGSTWTGRGKAPAWIRAQDREQFLIAN